MSTTTELLNIDRVKENFKDHVLTEILNTENFKVFEFAKPGTGIYRQKWIIDHGTLIVTGDCYDAIYWWNSTGLTLKFLAGCGLSYFSEKCRADKDGNRQMVYDSSVAEELIKEIICTNMYYYRSDQSGITMDEEEWKKLSTDQQFERLKPIIERILNESDSYTTVDGLLCHENGWDAHDTMRNPDFLQIFGEDTWEHDLESYTATPYFHLAALRVAYEKYPDAF